MPSIRRRKPPAALSTCRRAVRSPKRRRSMRELRAKGCLQSRAQSSAYLDTGRREGGDAQLLLQVATRVFRLRHMSARRTIIAGAGVSAPPAAACSSARRPNGSCVHSKARVGSPSRASNFCVEAQGALATLQRIPVKNKYIPVSGLFFLTQSEWSPVPPTQSIGYGCSSSRCIARITTLLRRGKQGA